MKMLRFNIVIILMLLMYKKVLLKEIQCPSNCKCDTFKNYRRATCRNQSLIVVEADIPPEAELLDLSYNLIHELDNHIFVDLKLTNLKLLNLSHNKIGQIHMKAFTGMNSVKTIDLSHNNIEYLLVNWFWETPILEELYLGNNNLRKLEERPILESKTLKVLDLSDCSLLHVHAEAFSALPNLQVLGLSGNSLIQLNVKVVKPLKNLKTLKLESNTWHCNDIMTNLIKYCDQHEISCKDPCAKSRLPNKEEKFQRMVVQPKIELDEPPNSWIYEESLQGNQTIIEICSNSNSTDIDKGLLMEIIELSPILAVTVPFLFGLGLGLVIACGLATPTKKKAPKKKKPLVKRRTSIIRSRRRSEYDYPLMQPEFLTVSDTTPIPFRKNIFRNSADLEGFM